MRIVVCAVVNVADDPRADLLDSSAADRPQDRFRVFGGIALAALLTLRTAVPCHGLAAPVSAAARSEAAVTALLARNPCLSGRALTGARWPAAPSLPTRGPAGPDDATLCVHANGRSRSQRRCSRAARLLP